MSTQEPRTFISWEPAPFHQPAPIYDEGAGVLAVPPWLAPFHEARRHIRTHNELLAEGETPARRS